MSGSEVTVSAAAASRNQPRSLKVIVWSAAVSNLAHKGASDLRMLALVEKWMAIIREINRERPDGHRVDYVI
jgi:hypothetical protein